MKNLIKMALVASLFVATGNLFALGRNATERRAPAQQEPDEVMLVEDAVADQAQTRAAKIARLEKEIKDITLGIDSVKIVNKNLQDLLGDLAFAADVQAATDLVQARIDGLPVIVAQLIKVRDGKEEKLRDLKK